MKRKKIEITTSALEFVGNHPFLKLKYFSILYQLQNTKFFCVILVSFSKFLE